MKPWVIAIAVMLGTAFLLFVTGNLVISTKPAETENGTSSGGSSKGSKIVYELTPEEEAARAAN